MTLHGTTLLVWLLDQADRLVPLQVTGLKEPMAIRLLLARPLLRSHWLQPLRPCVPLTLDILYSIYLSSEPIPVTTRDTTKYLPRSR